MDPHGVDDDVDVLGDLSILGLSLLACLCAVASAPVPSALDAPVRWEWRRRWFGLLAHTALSAANLGVIASADPKGQSDLTTAYTRDSHIGFVFAGAMYGVDTAMLVLHPRKSAKTKAVWAAHHAGSMALLVAITRVRQGSFPAACFMVSSATHTTCNVRWMLQTVTGRKGSPADKLLGALNAALFFAVAVAPVPYMFWLIAQQKGMRTADLFGGDWVHVRRKCLAGTLAIFVPHVALWVRIVAKEAGRALRPEHVPKRVAGRGRKDL